MDKKRVLVIGASGAFGSLFVSKLLAQGYEVLAAARNTDAISDSASLKLKLDLEDPGSIELLANYLLDQNLTLDGIIQAAGVVGFGRVEETSAADAARMMQINHLGPADLITRLISLIQENGFVVGINGIVSERIFPGMAAYSSSKFANAAFLSTLALELRRKKILVLDAKPGHTETGLAGRAIFGQAPAFPQGMTADHVVSKILEYVNEGKASLPSSEF
jgi:cyclic-di-GMP-binding biofilm dispersal mediator protein